MPIAHAFLGLLDQGPQYGYMLKQRFDDWFGEARVLRYGQVYATLARLQKQGLAEVVAVESGAGPERKRYAITRGGVEELESWLATPQPAEEVALGDLYTKTVVALLSGRSAGDVLDAQRAVHTERMRALRRATAGGSVEQGLATDYLIAHLQADLDWIELAGARLRRGEG
ncbi:MAG TPA: PadR family transcriptional regulator [Acidimicrobiales bacterium]